MRGYCPGIKPTQRRLVALFALGATVVIAAICLRLLRPIVGQLHLRHDLTWYDLGWYGLAPTRRYRSFEQPVTNVEFLRRDARCSRDYILFAPRGPATVPGGAILDHTGEPIWRQFGTDEDVQDFKVQNYRGERFLTFWAGHENNGRKEGQWYMLDETYAVRYEIKPGKPYEIGDMHEFQLTTDGTALISIYEPVEADLTALGGVSDGYILDNIFQEIDIETGEVRFEWSAAAHLPLDTTYNTLDRCSHRITNAFNGCGDRPELPFDYYHLNSIEKDGAGNYLVSGRNTFTLSYIDGKTGEVLWNLGGRHSDFTDLSDGKATAFMWQHDAHFHEDQKSISLFDNKAHNAFDDATESRAIIIGIDVAQRIVELQSEYANPQQLLAFSQGSVQLLNGSGNVFVGWGRSAAFTEFAADGDVLCDARFGASAFSSFGAVTSYRVFRDSWVGRPTDEPSAVAEGGRIYVSWNGATEVVAWRVEGAEARDGEWPYEGPSVLREADKTGFETEISVSGDKLPSLVRVAALDKDGAVLGVSKAIEGRFGSGMSPLSLASLAAFVVCVTTIGAVCALISWYRHRRRSKEARNGYHLVGSGAEGEGRVGGREPIRLHHLAPP